MRSGRTLLPVLVACLLSPAWAQEPPAEDSTFFEEVEVNVVSVEVFVTDRDGNAISGLTRDDFEVYDAGRRVEISNFFAVEGGKASLAVAGPAPAPGQQPAEPTDAAVLAPDQRLNMAVFFDNQTLSLASRKAALESLRGFLGSRLGPQDSLMIIRYDGQNRVLMRPVAAQDATALEAALQEVTAVPPGGLNRNAEMRELLRQIELAPGWEEGVSGDGGDVAFSDARSTLERVRDLTKKRYNEVKATIATLEQVSSTLAALPGRKALLFVSGGLPLRPGQAIAAAWQSKYGGKGLQQVGMGALESLTVDATDSFKRLGESANASGVTFYAIGAPRELDAASAEFGSSRVWTAGMSRSEKDNLLQSMMLVSVPTGGIADPDSVEPEILLQKMERDLGSYYSLGFTPARRAEGGVSKLEVRTKRPGLKVRHRQSYRVQTGPERMKQKVLSALLRGPGADNPLGVSLELEAEKPGEAKGEVLVGLLVKLPMTNLVLLPQESFHEGRVMVYVGSRDARGQLSEVTQIAVPVRVPNDQILTALGQTVAYRTNLRLRPGPHTIAVSVRDELSKLASTATLPCEAGQAEGAGAR